MADLTKEERVSEDLPVSTEVINKMQNFPKESVPAARYKHVRKAKLERLKQKTKHLE